jgi:glucokinase
MNKKYSIGIDLGGTNIVAAVVDSDGNILSELDTPTAAGRPDHAILDDMVRLAEEALTASGVSRAAIEGVGAVAPGATNKSTGIVEFANNLAWKDVPMRAYLEQALNLPVYIENDANAAAFGEYTVGAAKGYESVIMVTIGTGIGGGFVVGGKIYDGANFAAMEIGHMVIVKDGRPCPCGRLGCWESYGSATGLITTTKEYMKMYPNSMLWEMAGGDLKNVNGQIPFEAMKKGDEAAAKVVASFIDSFSCGLASLINILQPDIITVGGGISNQGETLLAPVREKVAVEIYTRNSKSNPKIVRAALGSHAGVIGAANLFREIQ